MWGILYLFSWHVIGIFNSLWFVIAIFYFAIFYFYFSNRQLTVNSDCIVLLPVNGDCLHCLLENPVNCDLNITRDTWFRLLSVKYLGVTEIYIRRIAQNVPILMIFWQIFQDIPIPIQLQMYLDLLSIPPHAKSPRPSHYSASHGMVAWPYIGSSGGGGVWVKTKPPSNENQRISMIIFNNQHSLSPYVILHMSNKIYLMQYIMLVQVFHCIINYFGIFNLCLVTTILIANCCFSKVYVTKYGSKFNQNCTSYF